MAQIENQKASINRLLEDGSYTNEMQTLFQAASVLQVENEAYQAALRGLISAVDALPDNRAGGDRLIADALAWALAEARRLAYGVSSPVSESGASAG